MRKNHIDIINEDLKIDVGMGATYHCGSDSYPYYVSEVLPKGVIGLYNPDSRFDDEHPWEGGVEVVDPFDASQASEIYIKRLYGNWWECTKDGKKVRKWHDIHFGYAHSYRDPSF